APALSAPRHGQAGAALLMLLAAPPVRHLLESSLVGHMGLQIPLLVAAGWLLGRGLPPRIDRAVAPYNAHGVPAILLALFTTAYWMLPRNVDATLGNGAMELLKFVSLPLSAGIPLALGWICLPLIGRGLLWSNLLAMLFVMAWLYLESPVRICNFYLVNQQTLLGGYCFAAGVALSLMLIIRVFTLDLHARMPSPAHSDRDRR
ncbi:MAG TPA: hypothetical protein VKA04_06470, partial [Pseudodesulfovibrio sp.]|nr:hypothetical protein [Pseudodesulfovibrio sp.]